MQKSKRRASFFVLEILANEHFLSLPSSILFVHCTLKISNGIVAKLESIGVSLDNFRYRDVV